MSIYSLDDLQSIYNHVLNSVDINQKRNQSADYYQLKENQYEALQLISKAHIDSFNYMLDFGINEGIKNIDPLQMDISNDNRLILKLIDLTVGKPIVNKECIAKNRLIYPSECRMRGITYKAPLTLSFAYQLNGTTKEVFQENVGDIPIMIKSKRCHLANLNPKDLVKNREDAEEFGGYFIINGKERLIRFLTAQRRNYPLAIKRRSWKESGQLFTDYGISIRCVDSSQNYTNMILHYLSNGTARLRLYYYKDMIFFPIMMILKSLLDVTDQFIFKEIIKGREDDNFLCRCISTMLRLVQEENLLTQQHVKQFIGERFRMKAELPTWYKDEEITDYLLQKCVAIHLKTNEEKFNLLIFMIRKLFTFVKGECSDENSDNPMFHELTLSGHLYFNILLDRCEYFLRKIRINLEKMKNSGDKITITTIKKTLQANFSFITKSLEYLLATGNALCRKQLPQLNGFSIVAEKLNFWRFLSNFRSVHRGSFFSELRTTECRKLYPEAWGFLCPVHTPDGEPCGLLNHLADFCFVVNFQPSIQDLKSTLIQSGMELISSPPFPDYKKYYQVLIDGLPYGYLHDSLVKETLEQLHIKKSLGKLSTTIEVGFIPKSKSAAQYPGLFIFSTPARLMRPVYNLKTKNIELIGTFEQPYMEISVSSEEIIPGVTTHQDISENTMLSILAKTIPYPDFNQSPRNMYACQMCKQTMGTASHTLKYRCDNKMYNILYPQAPLVRTATHELYHMDDYPMGTNAVVAVISYTGYDMEDALILNKSSVERGFKHGSIHKTIRYNLKSDEKYNIDSSVFGRSKNNIELDDKIDMDGLPFIGSKIENGDVICSYIDFSGTTLVEKYRSTEAAYISDVKILGNDTGKAPLQNVAIDFYIPRRPTIGDKFANRHGQKGVCSFLWPMEDMPFTSNGITPDVIFNPHGYPSRMTIGMMLESLAGKSSSLHGVIHDSTPFIFSEDEKASEYYGQLLNAAGYNYYGTEMMFSGVDGRPLKADIFIGVIFYIRLRHMVGDKYQVRSTGPIDSLTHQPVKGRRRAGGIRFGEMERDSLLAHGASFLVQDRLFNQSDKSMAHGCSKCGSIISTLSLDNDSLTRSIFSSSNQVWYCKLCNTSEFVKTVFLPYPLRYLVAELASVNIKLQFKF